ncbi:MAG: chromate transporter [Bdellovibrio sp.]
MSDSNSPESLRDTLGYFFKLGWTGFGGPLSVISQIQEECVKKRKWISLGEFQRALPVLKSLPGPVAYQTVLYVAQKRVGSFWALVSAVLFVVPAFFMMILLATGSEWLKSIETFHSFFLGAQAAALILIFSALKDLTRPYWMNRRFWLYGIFAFFLLVFVAIPEPMALLLCGGVSVMGRRLTSTRFRGVSLELFWICFQAGALAFGTGLTIVPLLQDQFGRWVSEAVFLEAVALGQLTPGPVVISVTYLGFKVAGWTGALVATLGIFLPATIHILSWFSRVMNWLNSWSWFPDFILGAMACLGVGIGLSLFHLSKGLLPSQFMVLGLVLVALFLFKRSGAYWIFIGGILHVLLTLVF